MNSILVTGGCGFIGSNFVRILLRDDAKLLKASGFDRIVNVDALTYAGNPANLTDLESSEAYLFSHTSILDQGKIASLIKENSVSAIVHFAAESHVDRSIDTPEPFVETNVTGTLCMLEAARHHWAGLEGDAKADFRFLHVSTDEVFGTLKPEDPAFCETTPYAPNSPYSASKASSDFLVRAYYHTYGFPVVTTNCSNNYGPYQFPEKLIPLVTLNALEGKPLPIYGDGKQIRDWLFVEDHCTGILAALQKGDLGETYCIGGRSEMENIQIVKRICALLDELAPVAENENAQKAGIAKYEDLITYVKDRPGHDRRYAINCDRIAAECDWKPAETFDTGIRKTIQWYLENLAWCQDIAEKKYARERLGNA
ncbi:dTDP-glucose 4,6-dehydratase [Pelagicoccus sp. SDUM812003]|uniref:dTDP-glucose 4,6-dehydratase n=1 Tax=Pelagicoccus sp. SDUM812003 TaxID=3041267 RepID=UPI00280C9CB6|nr:dTDP-glucose 4,6-dehydratase [Pelagicoccus sp. SDUM812003]MDQ8205194.1 dTDP-glucose 4,6-dehydratase [Pelagicoccus sp. SDUM812003]